MTKFKSGDRVERTWVVGDSTTQLTGIERRGIYTVDVVCGDAISLVESLRPNFTFPSELFELAEEQDDPLPPAPESVRYNEGAGGFPFEVKSLLANEYHPNRIRLGVLCGDRDITHKYVVIDPDAALQLAHDLNRMANEIKRKEKQRG